MFYKIRHLFTNQIFLKVNFFFYGSVPKEIGLHYRTVFPFVCPTVRRQAVGSVAIPTFISPAIFFTFKVTEAVWILDRSTLENLT